MQVGRSNAFLQRLLPAVKRHFGDQAAFEEHNFIARNQRVKHGFIRVDADEVSYPAHVILRYEIERALINGDIEVDDIPALWDEKCRHGWACQQKRTIETAVCRISTGPTAGLVTSVVHAGRDVRRTVVQRGESCVAGSTPADCRR